MIDNTPRLPSRPDITHGAPVVAGILGGFALLVLYIAAFAIAGWAWRLLS